MSADTDLCTVEDVTSYLSLSDGQDTDLIQNLITNASAFIDNYCNRVLLSNDYTETHNGTGGDELPFRQFPVSAVASVSIDGQPVTLSTSTSSSGFVWDDWTLYLRGYCFPRGAQNVTISYTAGLMAVPPDVNQACIEIVALKYKRRTSLEVSSKTLNGEVISFNTSDMPASAKSTLANYRRVFMA
jgi:hypothetical protein